MRSETIYLYEDRTDVTLTSYILEDLFEMLHGKNRPAACILGYALTDYHFMKKSLVTADPMAKAMFGLSALAFLGTEKPDEEMLDMVSPCRHVTECMPPTFLWATAEDGRSRYRIVSVWQMLWQIIRSLSNFMCMNQEDMDYHLERRHVQQIKHRSITE